VDVFVAVICIAPLGLNRHDGELLLEDEPLREPCALAVELTRSMRSLSEKNESAVADELQERVVVAR
jgi:hypothetical protein